MRPQLNDGPDNRGLNNHAPQNDPSPHNEIRLICVPPDRLIDIWRRAEPILLPAYDQGPGDESFDTLKGDLFGNRALLWIVMEDGQIIGAVATSIFITQTGKKLCRIRACAGRDLERWKHLIADIEAFGKAEGCTHSRIEGRPGWKKLFPDYEQPCIILERRL